MVLTMNQYKLPTTIVILETSRLLTPHSLSKSFNLYNMGVQKFPRRCAQRRENNKGTEVRQRQKQVVKQNIKR